MTAVHNTKPSIKLGIIGADPYVRADMENIKIQR